MRNRTLVGAGLALGASCLMAVAGWAQMQMGEPTHPPGTPPQQHGKAPVRTTMEELHKHGGVPPGWQFTLPGGNSKAGRDVFVKLECYTCHEVKGEQFPNAPTKEGQTGPELTVMGAQHPAEYFAESIMNPNSVIVIGPGYTGPDGLSTMPDYSRSLTVRELIDLVAYLKSLQGAHHH